MSLKYKKVYIDTRYKTPDSNSTSDFKISLPESISFGGDTAFYVDDFTCGHSWYSIEDFNNKLYLHLKKSSGVDDIWSYIITISNGNYTGSDFALELQNKLRAATNNAIVVNLFNVSYNSKNNNLTISITNDLYTFKILTTDDLKTSLNNTFLQNYDKQKPNDCNEVLSNLNGLSPFYSISSPYISGFLNLQPINNIYLHFSSLGNYNSLSCDGSQTVIRKIPVSQDSGIVIHDQCLIFNDFNECSHQTIKMLDFQLKTASGVIIPLHGININFSVVFTRADTSV